MRVVEPKMKAVSSWGRLDSLPHHVLPLYDRSHAAEAMRGALPGIPHGMGRSYGDVCLNPGGHLWMTRGLDRFVAFDDHSGRLVCEAGVLLRDIQELALSRGWLLPVTPGTQLVTVGGAIANDVHGKNHHRHGTFGDHVLQITLLRSDGETIECGPQLRAKWFAATVGGLGLTGLVLTAQIQLRPAFGPWVENESLAFSSFDEFFFLADSSELEWEHTVAWIDCLPGGQGRGLFMRGNHIEGGPGDHPMPIERDVAMPFCPPFPLVNGLTLRAFNAVYFNLKKRRCGRTISHYEQFLYPLDHIAHWNRMYGRRGFYQYQCVLPRACGQVALQSLLREIAEHREGSFLAVLKTFGDRLSPGMLSFVQPGVTLALDFSNKGEQSLKLFERLDCIVAEAGGRLYPAKDARMPERLFRAGYPQLESFLAYRDPGISSALSRRLMGA